jgi:hypothetical protein
MTLPCYAWLCTPVGSVPPYAFPFSTEIGQWRRCPRLIVESYTIAARGRGSASFQLLHNHYREPGHSPVIDVDPIVAGQWVIITEGAELQTNTMVWLGRISAVLEAPLAAELHGTGTVTAEGMNEACSAMRLDTWVWDNPDAAYGNRVMTPPTANFQRGDGVIVGNAKAFTDNGLPPGLTSVYVFARKASECGTAAGKIFTRKRLLDHVLRYAFQGAVQREGSDASELILPRPELIYQVADIATVIDDTTHPEVFPLIDLTLTDLLDMVAPESLGLSWDIIPSITSGQIGWTIVPSCTTTTPCFADVPGCKADVVSVTTTSDELTGYELSEVIGDCWDQVVVRGAPIVFGVTVGYKDRNFQKVWSDALQTDFKDAKGETATVNANRQERALPKYAAVGRRFVVTSTHEWDIRSQAEPISGSVDLSSGIEYGTGVVPLIPRVVYGSTSGSHDAVISLAGTSYTAFKIDPATSRAPYQPLSRLLPDLPWPKGMTIGTSGVILDSRTDDEKARPCWLEPRLFRYVTATTTWTDLLRQDQTERPQMRADDAGLILDIDYSDQEYLLRNRITSWYGLLQPVIDWQELALTLALESDQRLESVRYRLGTRADTSPSRVLIIDRQDLCTWILRKGAVIGLKDDGTPARNTSFDIMVRDDYPIADRLCAAIAAAVFSTRRAATLRVRGDRKPTWMALGQGIDKIIDKIRIAGTTVTGFSNAATDTIDASGHGYSDGDSIVFSEPPPGLNAGTTYYVTNASYGHYQVSSSPGGEPLPMVNGAVSSDRVKQASHEIGTVIVEIQRTCQGRPGWIVRTQAGTAMPTTPRRTGPDRPWNLVP